MKCYLCDEEIDLNNPLSYRIDNLRAVHVECLDDTAAEARMEND